MTNGGGFRRAAAFCCLLAVADACPGQETGGPSLSQEYFVQQNADEVLLIRVNTFEAEFESRVFGPGGEPLSAARVAGNSMAPVFHYVGGVSEPRQLGMKVVSDFYSNRSGFELELSRLMVRDDRTRRLALGYQYLGLGIQADSTVGTANWSVKVNSLLSAASIFQSFGMEELRLWSLYFAAWLVHHQLGDQNTVLDYTDLILTSIRIMPFRDIELAALQLQGQALASLREAGSLPPPESGPDPVQAMLERASDSAAAMGYQLEQARALFASGQDFAGRAMYPAALERFEKALDLADALDTGEFATRIREHMVEIHDTHGDVIASGAVLQDIETQLTAAGAGDELAENLLAQGRLFNQTYRYPRAIGALTQALQHERGSLMRARIQVELARAHYGQGNLEDALRHAQNAVVNPQTGEFRRPNPALETRVALNTMASVYRVQGDFDRMHEARDAQRSHLGATDQRAAYLYARGLDRLAEGGTASRQAPSIFRSSREAAVGAAQSQWRHLSTLQICARDAGQAGCGGQQVQQALAALKAGGIPAAALEGAFLYASIQLDAGRVTQATATLDGLLDDLHFYRRVVPGTLGAWYWRSRGEVFSNSLTLANRRPHGRGGGFHTLLTLSKIRWIENTAGKESRPWQADIDPAGVRVLLARRENPDAGESITRLNQRIGESLQEARASFSREFSFLSEQGMQAYIDGLGADEAVLTFHLDADSGYVLLASGGRVRRISLTDAKGLSAALQSAWHAMSSQGGAAFDRLMEDLGRRLLGPVASSLPAKVYFIPSGSLMGVPLGAFRYNGRYLAEAHDVVNLLKFPFRPNPAKTLSSLAPRRVFLAGDPSDYSGDYLTRLEISNEIQAVTNVFVGPGLTIVQGSALQPDEFSDAGYQQADVAHLAMPVYMALREPAHSSLELSEAVRGQGRTRLGLNHIRSWPIQARLVFVSSARLGEYPISSYDGRLGLVSAFLDAGAGAVIASSWGSQDHASVEMIGDFYRRLAGGADLGAALAESKRAQVNSGSGNELRDWARLQMYTD